MDVSGMNLLYVLNITVCSVCTQMFICANMLYVGLGLYHYEFVNFDLLPSYRNTELELWI